MLHITFIIGSRALGFNYLTTEVDRESRPDLARIVNDVPRGGKLMRTSRSGPKKNENLRGAERSERRMSYG